MNPHPEDALVLGIDVGTSAVRCVAVDAQDSIVAQARQPLPPPLVTGSRVTQDPRLWWDATETAVMQTVAAVSAERIAAIAVDGTSGTVLLTDAQGTPQTEGWLYNDASCVAEATRIAAVAPRDSPARGASSPLARLLHLQAALPAGPPPAAPGRLDQRAPVRSLRRERREQRAQAGIRPARE